jgi:hypothetical protein
VASGERGSVRRGRIGIQVLLFASAFLGLAALTSGHLYSIDGLNYYRASERLLFSGSFVFDPPLVWDPSISGTVPSGPIGFSLAYIPALLLASPLHGTLPRFTDQPYDVRLLYDDPMYAAASWVEPAIVAGMAALMYILGRRLGASAQLSVVGAVVTVVSTPLLFYARADFAQPLTSFLLLVAIVVVLRVRSGTGRGLALGPIVAWSVLTRPVDGTLLAAIVVVGLVVSERDREVAASRRLVALASTAGGFVVGLTLGLASNWIRAGQPFDYRYGQGFSGDLVTGTAALLISPGRGLVLYAPIVVLAAYGVLRLHRSGRRAEMLLLALPIVLYVPIYAMWAGLGGWSWGPRFLLPTIAPLIGLAIVAVVSPAPTSLRRLFGVLAMVGIAANLGHVAVDPLQGFWGDWGDSVFGTPGYDRQFEPGAYAPIGIWSYRRLEGPVQLADLLWLRLAATTGGAALVPMAVYLAGAAGAFAVAWRRATNARP